MEAKGIEFFGEVDKKNGKLMADYPAWYFDRNIEKLEESIDERKRRLEMSILTDDQRNKLIKSIDKDTKQLNKIYESKIELKGKKKDDIAKMSGELGAAISQAMFRKSEIKERLADPYDEYRRENFPCIKVTGDIAEQAAKMGMRIDESGKISRGDAARMWKVMQKSLGEISNTEILRRK